jgi:hypothetical protein
MNNNDWFILRIPPKTELLTLPSAVGIAFIRGPNATEMPGLITFAGKTLTVADERLRPAQTQTLAVAAAAAGR